MADLEQLVGIDPQIVGAADAVLMGSCIAISLYQTLMSRRAMIANRQGPFDTHLNVPTDAEGGHGGDGGVAYGCMIRSSSQLTNPS